MDVKIEADQFEIAHRARIYWQCRRGMRELDELLQGFFSTCYDRLASGERCAFERLLEQPDQLLMEFLMGRMVPTDGALQGIVDQIRRNTAD